METNAALEDLLRGEAAAIVDRTWPTVAQLDHFRRHGTHTTRRWLTATYQQVADAVLTRDLEPLRTHLSQVARERYEAGFDYFELQTAFSTLGQAIEKQAVARLPIEEWDEVLGLVDAALADAQGALGQAYVAAESARPADQAAEAALLGAEAELTPRDFEEFVYPV